MASKSLKVCVIDDDDIHQYVMETTLVDLPEVESIIPFLSAHQALDYFKDSVSDADRLPDVVFLDLNMPGMDGRDFLKELTPFYELLSKKPVLWVLSSSTLKADLNIKNEFPIVADYFVKPMEIPEIQEKIFSLAQ